MSQVVPGKNTNTRRSRSITEMSWSEARDFLLSPESYCSIDLPPYFEFSGILRNVAKELSGKKLADFRNPSPNSPRDFDDVNHLILHNKDGRYAWRPFELIHPALYVSLVNQITESQHWGWILDRFAEFGKNDKIKCLSLPVKSLSEEKDKAEQISHWWHAVEQASIEYGAGL